MGYKETLLKALDSDDNFTSTASLKDTVVSSPSSSSVAATRKAGCLPTQVAGQGQIGGRRERKRGGRGDREEEAGGMEQEEDPLKQQKEELMKVTYMCSYRRQTGAMYTHIPFYVWMYNTCIIGRW